MQKRKVLKQRKLTRARFLGNCTAIPKGKLGWVYWDDFAGTFGFLFEKDSEYGYAVDARTEIEIIQEKGIRGMMTDGITDFSASILPVFPEIGCKNCGEAPAQYKVSGAAEGTVYLCPDCFLAWRLGVR